MAQEKEKPFLPPSQISLGSVTWGTLRGAVLSLHRGGRHWATQASFASVPDRPAARGRSRGRTAGGGRGSSPPASCSCEHRAQLLLGRQLLPKAATQSALHFFQCPFCSIGCIARSLARDTAQAIWQPCLSPGVSSELRHQCQPAASSTSHLDLWVPALTGPPFQASNHFSNPNIFPQCPQPKGRWLL